MLIANALTVNTPRFEIEASPDNTTPVATLPALPTKIFAEVNVDVNFELNVVKSLDAKYPLTDAVAREISTDGELDEALTVIGLPAVAAAVTEVTVPAPPPIVVPLILKLPVTFTSPATDNAKLGVEVPIPTLLPLTTRFVPTCNPFAGKNKAPVIVSPALFTGVYANAVVISLDVVTIP